MKTDITLIEDRFREDHFYAKMYIGNARFITEEVRSIEGWTSDENFNVTGVKLTQQL